MGRRDLPFSLSISELHVVPVTISYEYDACDVLKADELYQIEKNGNFIKTDKSDIQSIVKGMIGFKGRVHVAFGNELEIKTDNPDDLAEKIDSQILENYVLSDSNFLALEKLKNYGLAPERLLGNVLENRNISSKSRKKFDNRLNGVNRSLHKHFLFGYANPVIKKLEAGFTV